MGYIPPFSITEEMLAYVSAISEKVGRIPVPDTPARRPYLRRSRIRSLHASLRIEANSLSLGQVEDVLDGKQVMGDREDILEVKNAYAAYEQIGRADPYSLDELKRVHGIMTAGLMDESGAFRNGEEGVFSGGKCVFMAPPARLVASHMEDLFEWVASAKKSLHPLLLSSVFHYELVFIHPFADGNGRMARLWQTMLLARWKPVFAYLPIESKIESFQADYYDAISACNSAGNSDAFIAFMLRQIDAALAEAARERAAVPPRASRLSEVMEYGVSYSAAELMARLGLRSRSSFSVHYLRPALDAGVIKMTVPDKPTSREQRYVKCNP